MSTRLFSFFFFEVKEKNVFGLNRFKAINPIFRMNWIHRAYTVGYNIKDRIAAHRTVLEDNSAWCMEHLCYFSYSLNLGVMLNSIITTSLSERLSSNTINNPESNFTNQTTAMQCSTMGKHQLDRRQPNRPKTFKTF